MPARYVYGVWMGATLAEGEWVDAFSNYRYAENRAFALRLIHPGSILTVRRMSDTLWSEQRPPFEIPTNRLVPCDYCGITRDGKAYRGDVEHEDEFVCDECYDSDIGGSHYLVPKPPYIQTILETSPSIWDRLKEENDVAAEVGD